jgi:hypothetical protein
MRIKLQYISTFFGSLMLFCCLFDPQDLLLGLKIPLFVLFITSVTVIKYVKRDDFKIPAELLLFILLFSVSIPAISTIVFYLRNNFSFVGYQGLLYLKSYLFLSLTVFLFFDRNQLLNVLIRLLLLLSAIIVILFLTNLLFPQYSNSIFDFGAKYGIYAMPLRKYGSISYMAIYFHASPLLVISLGYYLYRFIKDRGISNFIFLFITILALLFSGTRNNVFSTIIMSVGSYLIFSRNISNRQLIVLLIFSIVVFFLPSIVKLVYNSPISDKTRLQFVNEYFKLMKDPSTFFFGQGFGSSFITSERGIVTLTELTYFEIFRRFGLVLGLLQCFLMFYPLAYWKSLPADKKWIIIAYGYYLLMISFNPFYFSSNGMVILSFVLISKYSFKNYD